MRIIALIDDVDVLERILKHLKVWDPQPDTLTPAGPDLTICGFVSNPDGSVY